MILPMTTPLWLPTAQSALTARHIDAWLVHDFRGNNSVLTALLGKSYWTTRRVVLIVPAQGEPTLLVHAIDDSVLRAAPIKREVYLSWQDFRAALARHCAQFARVAMEYAPGAMLPVVSIVDAGTVEFIRSLGLDVTSSANLVQTCIARWSDEATANHERASKACATIMQEAFGKIRHALSTSTPTTEYQVQQFIMDRFKQEGLETADTPIVGINGHAGDPHFEVSKDNPSTFKKGDWVLIDLWARVPGEANIFSDITWTGYCGSTVPEKLQTAFNAVLAGRDAAMNLVIDSARSNRLLQGWEVDKICYDTIIARGFKDGIRHRTGHSLSPGPKVHGVGVNIDNLETHDTRELIPGVGFTIEPGVYYPDFGIRSEINMHMHPTLGARVTSSIQREVVLLG